MNITQIKQHLKTWSDRDRSEEGLTLIECLVAIFVLSAVIISMTPPIMLAVATRAQNRKAEQALQIAHGAIDQVRVLVEKGNFNSNQIPSSIGNVADLTTIPAPYVVYPYLQSSNSSCSTFDTASPAAANPPTPVPFNTVVPVDVTGDCQPAFLMQTFSNQINGTTINGPDGNPVPIAFTMGVRVYSYEALNAITSNTAQTQQASLQLTTGLGNQQVQPLAVLYTDITQADQNISLGKYSCFKNHTCSP